MVYYDTDLDELTIQLDEKYEIPAIESINTLIQDYDLDWEFVELDDNKPLVPKIPLIDVRCKQYCPFNRWLT